VHRARLRRGLRLEGLQGDGHGQRPQTALGLKEADKLPNAIFTPSTKAEKGHDENITEDQARKTVGRELYEKVKDASLKVYKAAADDAAKKGIIIADTKFEFGVLPNGNVILIDEVLTPIPPVLARGPIQTRRVAAELRQTVRARLPRDHEVEQDAARARPSDACRRGDHEALPRGVPAIDGEGTHLLALRRRVG